ncbi:ATP-binding protein [Candidatus Omnitrophota bacterium]
MFLSFGSIRRLTVLIMIIIMIIVCAVSLVSTHKIIANLYDMIVHKRPISDKVHSIRDNFLYAKDIFFSYTRNHEIDISLAILAMNKVLKESMDLKGGIDAQKKESVNEFIKTAKLFKVAISTYSSEFEYDPSGASSFDMEHIAIAAAKAASDRLDGMFKDIRAKIRASDINMLIIAKNSQKIMWFSIFIGIIFCFLAAFFMGKALSAPINRLLKGTQEISKGDLSYRIKVGARDEIGKLAESFNKMSDDLNRYIQKEKQAVETAELKGRKLEAAYKELDEFTYTISHDLKEPLRTVDAFSKFLEMRYGDKLDDKGRHYIERIRVNASTMQNLIEDLLEISRVDRRKNPVEVVEIGDLIDEVKMRLEYAIHEKKADIIVRDKLPRLSCDRVRLAEVFLNLISNSIKFTDKKQPHVEIGCIEKNGFYEFYVKDNGSGIEEQYFDKVFKIFQRLGKREDHEGTGAGLTIVKKIIENNGGKIWVESKMGEGTTFYFTVKDQSENRKG